jgi:hypothetical protein
LVCFEQEMTTEERSILAALDTILQSEEVREQIYPIVERVRSKLARSAKAQMTWEPIPLTIYGGALPSGIRSSWVFVLRAGATTGAERHPNSHQRMMSFQGTGDLQTEKQEEQERPAKQMLTHDFPNRSSASQADNAVHPTASPHATFNTQRPTSNAEIKDGRAGSRICWQPNPLISDPEAPLDRRWISIPRNVWHQVVVPEGADWAVVSFHTVPAEQLIEERPGSSAGQTKQMRYLRRKQKLKSTNQLRP